MSTDLRNFLALSYEELEELNLKAKDHRKKHTPIHKVQEERIKYLTDEKRIKAVTVLFIETMGSSSWRMRFVLERLQEPWRRGFVCASPSLLALRSLCSC